MIQMVHPICPKNRAELDNQPSQLDRTMKGLQVPPLPDDLAKLGLKMEATTFTSGKGKPAISCVVLPSAITFYLSRRSRK